MYDIFYLGQKPKEFNHARKVGSIDEAYSLCRTRYFWIINYLSDCSDFDFLYEPVPWEAHQRHVWPSQWQTDGGPWLVPKNGYTDTNYHNNKVHRQASDNIVLIDHGDNGATKIKYKFKTRYVNSYLETLTRIVSRWDGEDDWIWVVSSICDYEHFPFSWHPSEWQQDLLHVFPSNEQKFGDTFYINVSSARENLKTVKMLDWYKLNFVTNITVDRRPMPINLHNADTHVLPIMSHTFTAPVEIFSNFDSLQFWEKETINLWSPETKNLVVATGDSNTVIVPREVQHHVKTQLYDYPYIVKKDKKKLSWLPAVFVDNGETCADENFEYCKEIIPNKLVRVQGVKGRKQSQHAAAMSVDYPWYFFIPAKLKVNPDFPWDWHPDKLQSPKHYIFHAENMVTGLTYGHMAAICYCRNLVLQTAGDQLDFTMESLHTVVPLLSGTATYTYDPKMAWRTAFREVIKLKHYLDQRHDIETEYRLDCWLNKSNGENGKFSVLGAQAALDYYNAVRGNFEELKKTYEWVFLDQLWEETSPHLNLK
jgi:hypothetical protein